MIYQDKIVFTCIYNAEGILKFSCPRTMHADAWWELNGEYRIYYRRSAFRRRWTHFCILSLRGGLARNGLWVLWLLKTFKESDCWGNKIHSNLPDQRKRWLIFSWLQTLDGFMRVLYAGAASWWSLGVSVHLTFFAKSTLNLKCSMKIAPRIVEYCSIILYDL